MSGFIGIMASHKMVAASSYVTTGLVLNFDAGNASSYPGSGTSWTDTAGSKVGTMGTGVTYSSTNGGVMTFNGTSNAIVSISGFTTLSNNFTLECWYQSNIVGSTYQPQLWSSGVTGSTGYMMGSYTGSSYPNAWKLTKYGIVDIYLSTALVPQNTNWHQVTYTYSSSLGVSCYLDGSLLGTYTGTSYTNNLTTSTTNQIGKAENGNHSGSIGSMRMWNTVLNSTQVAQNFTAVRNKYGI